MRVLVTICARGGSKGAKGKNIRLLLGKPLIDYTLKAASLFRKDFINEFITDIVVNSDSDAILNRADSFQDIDKVKRPEELSLDNTPKVPAIQFAVSYMERIRAVQYDYVIDLDVTSPLRTSRNIMSALKKCMDASMNYDLVFSAVPARRNPYFNMVELHDGYAFKIKESNYASRQEAPEVFDMNASIYCYKRDSLMNELKRITFEGKSGLVLMPETFVIDIDHDIDFTILELLIKCYFAGKYPLLFNE